MQHVLLYNVKGVTYNDYLQPLERAEMVREGNQVTILTYSRMRCVQCYCHCKNSAVR